MFPVSGELSACTVGADMSEAALELEEFLHGPGAVGEDNHLTGASTPSPAIRFVDVEGQGDRHLSHEIILATPLLLLSKASVNIIRTLIIPRVLVISSSGLHISLPIFLKMGVV